MKTIAQPLPQLRPFSVVGFSVNDEVLCHSCLRQTTPITGEKLSHTCRRGWRPVPDTLRTRIVALEATKVRPTQIVKQLRTTLPTVMRVLSGDDADSASCPACEASKRFEQRDILPLYFADRSVREEHCTYCGHKLLDLALQAASERAQASSVEHVTYGKGFPALRFDRRPEPLVLEALKKAGWKWSPRERVWADFTRTAEVPAGVKLPPKPPVVTARPPIIRRRRESAAGADATVD